MNPSASIAVLLASVKVVVGSAILVVKLSLVRNVKSEMALVLSACIQAMRDAWCRWSFIVKPYVHMQYYFYISKSFSGANISCGSTHVV